MKVLAIQISKELTNLNSSFIDNVSCYVVGWSGSIEKYLGKSDMSRDLSLLVERLNATGDAHD